MFSLTAYPNRIVTPMGLRAGPMAKLAWEVACPISGQRVRLPGEAMIILEGLGDAGYPGPRDSSQMRISVAQAVERVPRHPIRERCTVLAVELDRQLVDALGHEWYVEMHGGAIELRGTHGNLGSIDLG